MVLLLDLDDEVPDPHADPNEPAGFVLRQHYLNGQPDSSITPAVSKAPQDANVIERPNPNLNGLSAAVACYPIVTQITHNIDLNALHALSRTCRQIRANLLQYRTRLVQSTLRCENEAQTAQLAALKPAGQKWHILGEAGHLVSGKMSTCARDLVRECRRCGRVVCRNCTLKPPSPPTSPPATAASAPPVSPPRSQH
ncbi:hypothetical protein ABVK25_002159 [Lepraria finkii]|uniref:Uncharacterized protein n=1 Tax=Lepraria finkii TaxID=1340010 RepID=A0ABR4BJ77_9LECA